MDYSKFRRSGNVVTEDPIADQILLAQYQKFLEQNGMTPEQVPEGTFLPMQGGASPQQMKNPMAKELGIRDILPLVAALRAQKQ